MMPIKEQRQVIRTNLIQLKDLKCYLTMAQLTINGELVMMESEWLTLRYDYRRLLKIFQLPI